MTTLTADRLRIKGLSARSDATETLAPTTGKTSLADNMQITAHDSLEDISADWEILQREATATIYQRLDWVRSSLETIDRDATPLIVSGKMNGRIAFILPLCFSGGLFRKVRWIGGRHANFNMGLYSKAFLAQATFEDMNRIVREIATLAGGLGVVRLCCQPGSWAGAENPMLMLDHQFSANPAFTMDLAQGFDALLKRGNAKRKRKKFRSQQREAEHLGGYRLVRAQSGEDSRRIISIFLEQKAERMRERGVANAFSEQAAKQFLQKLRESSSIACEPSLALFALEAGGKTIATFGGGIHHNHLHGYFISVDLEQSAISSPGEMLIYLLLEHCAQNGITSADLGYGDERFKRSWSDERVEMFDVIAPIGTASWPLAAAHKLHSRAVRVIRRSRRLWPAVVKLRQMRSRALSLLM